MEVILPLYSTLVKLHLAMLHPALKSSAQKRDEHVRVSPKDGHKGDQGTGPPCLWKQTETIVVVQASEGYNETLLQLFNL